MELTKTQTFTMLINNGKQERFRNKFNFYAKYKWWCLSCGKVLYLGYNQHAIISIFCHKCYSLYWKSPTIVQYQYVRKLKNCQMQLMEGQVYLGGMTNILKNNKE